MAEEKTSKMMIHYRETKKKYGEAILFYRLGDFYEMFDDDAVLVSRLLDIALTARNSGSGQKAPMCGVPFHAAEGYIAKLLRLGHKVAICEQVSAPAPGKMVEREVVRVITPGTITSDLILDEAKNNYILCVVRQKDSVGVSYADISTGEFFVAEYTEDAVSRLNDLVTKLMPAEIICNYDTKEMVELLPINKIVPQPKPYLYLEKSFVYENAVEVLKGQFGETVLAVQELGTSKLSTLAAGALIDYLLDTQKGVLKQIVRIKKVDVSKFMILDSVARRNLEITENIRTRGKGGTLLEVLDNTKTSMGARCLRRWFDEPLRDEKEINFRLDGVEELYGNLVLRENLSLLLKDMRDIERLTSKIGMKTIMPKECQTLRESLQIVPAIKRTASVAKSAVLKEIVRGLEDLSGLEKLIGAVIADNPAAHLRDGGYIRAGFNQELEKYRSFAKNSNDAIMAFENRERERTGLSLSVAYNRVYGYYIEVAKELASRVPIEYHRKATVANSDRYFTEELKRIEDELLGAEETAKRIETEIYAEFRETILAYIEKLQTTARAIAMLDTLICLASRASKFNYVRPVINGKTKNINIVNGRHPVVENLLKNNDFIANSTYLNDTTDKLLVITGPNMAGKSTYMRQVAIITLMAHVGSFVPADSAEIAITDRIFTRVGASDDLASGQSTFMVEMMEMANILTHATDESLVVLDEIGRGTSTFDGLSIAWAILEFFAKRKSKVLFATHYHELSELEGELGGVKNYQISVKEENNSIIFLRKIVRGGANKSFGIEVAALAGIPQEVTARAKEISHAISQQDFNLRLGACEQTQNLDAPKENFGAVIDELRLLDINRLSPLEAFEILGEVLNKIK